VVTQRLALAVLLTLLSPGGAHEGNAAADISGDQIVAVSEKMIHVIEGLGDFSCETEVHYYHLGKEHQLYCFTFFWERKGTTRIKFSRPYPGLTASHKRGDTLVTIQPLPFLPFVKFRCSLYHSLVKSPSGQRMDQASIEYLSRFFYHNITSIQQKEHSFIDESATVAFTFWADDYTGGKEINRYQVTVSKDNWLPQRIERYNHLNAPIEVIIFKGFRPPAS